MQLFRCVKLESGFEILVKISIKWHERCILHDSFLYFIKLLIQPLQQLSKNLGKNNLNINKGKQFEPTLASIPPRPTLDFVPKVMDCWSPG